MSFFCHCRNFSSATSPTHLVIFLHAVHSPAASTKPPLRIGQRLLAVDDFSLFQAQHGEALAILKQCAWSEGDNLTLVGPLMAGGTHKQPAPAVWVSLCRCRMLSSASFPRPLILISSFRKRRCVCRRPRRCGSRASSACPCPRTPSWWLPHLCSCGTAVIAAPNAALRSRLLSLLNAPQSLLGSIVIVYSPYLSCGRGTRS